MLFYLDTVVIIYAVEGNPADQRRAATYLAVVESAGHRFAPSDLSRTECLVPLHGPAGGQRLSDFYRFFHAPNVQTVPLTAAVYVRAAAIRGGNLYAATNSSVAPKRYGLADALHLAAAIEAGCDRFVTYDARLANFADILVDILPP